MIKEHDPRLWAIAQLLISALVVLVLPFAARFIFDRDQLQTFALLLEIAAIGVFSSLLAKFLRQREHARRD